MMISTWIKNELNQWRCGFVQWCYGISCWFVQYFQPQKDELTSEYKWNMWIRPENSGYSSNEYVTISWNRGAISKVVNSFNETWDFASDHSISNLSNLEFGQLN